MSNLVKAASMPAHVQVTIETKASPLPGPLRLTRDFVQNSPEARALFQSARQNGLTGEALAGALQEIIAPTAQGDEGFDAACQYLADEYCQIGDSVLLISPETGKAIAKITEKDLYQPPQMVRESGNVITPAPRLRPELEGFLIQWKFDRAAEDQTALDLVSHVTQTDLLKQDGDRRLFFATREGRIRLAQEIRDVVGTLLPGQTKGSAKTLFNHVVLGAPPSPYKSAAVKVGTSIYPSASRVPLMDKKAKNLQQDPYTHILAVAVTTWSRTIASEILWAATKTCTRESVKFEELPSKLSSTPFWASNPNVAVAPA